MAQGLFVATLSYSVLGGCAVNVKHAPHILLYHTWYIVQYLIFDIYEYSTTAPLRHQRNTPDPRQQQVNTTPPSDGSQHCPLDYSNACIPAMLHVSFAMHASLLQVVVSRFSRPFSLLSRILLSFSLAALLPSAFVSSEYHFLSYPII